VAQCLRCAVEGGVASSMTEWIVIREFHLMLSCCSVGSLRGGVELIPQRRTASEPGLQSSILL
jgi:hypothetical protein